MRQEGLQKRRHIRKQKDDASVPEKLHEYSNYLVSLRALREAAEAT